MIQYMHGVGVFLPNRVKYLVQMSFKLKTDIIVFAYRGFSQSDVGENTKDAFELDIEAIANYFSTLVHNEGGSE